MYTLKWVVYAAALFFASGWTLALIRRPDFRFKNIVVTVFYWWLGIGLSIAGVLNPFHLLWFMPIAFLVPRFIMFRMFGPFTSTVSVFLSASIPLLLAIYVAVSYYP